MSAQPIELYGSALTSHSTPRDRERTTWRLRYKDGRSVPLALARWCGEPDAVDHEVLARCADPTLDVGCGPGRLVAALAARGRDALGVDIAAAAVELARSAGARVVQGSIFAPVPDEGTWGTALLIDGNIGIGGDPVALLGRCRAVVAPDGVCIVELDPPGGSSSSTQVRLESPWRRSRWFHWAQVAANEIDAPATAAGLRVVDSWEMEGRWFACLAR